LACLDDIPKYPIHRILVKNAEIPVSQEVSLQRFQLEAKFIRTVANRDRAEIRQAGLRTDRSEFGRGDRDFVTGKLIRPAFDTGQFCIYTGFSMFFGIFGHATKYTKMTDEN